MQTKRFIAKDMRRALDMVKEEFGEDAMIISTQRTNQGVELVASVEVSVEQLLPQAPLNPPVSDRQQKISEAASRLQSKVASGNNQYHPDYQSVSQGRGLASGKTQEQLAQELEVAVRKMKAARQAESMTLETWADQQSSTPVPNVSSVMAKPVEESHKTGVSSGFDSDQQWQKREQEIHELHTEIAAMRTTIQEQLSTIEAAQHQHYNDLSLLASSQVDTSVKPIGVISEVKQQLESLGLNKACNDQLAASLPTHATKENKRTIWLNLLADLSRQLPCNTLDVTAKGGVYAFLGTTGVGKTTTIAKLAARYVLQHGADNVTLLTTDTYRVASHNQLRAFGKILNVDVQVVEKLEHLPRYLRGLAKNALVLIDTPGMTHADPLLKTHLRLLKRCPQVAPLLVLAASSQYQMMKASLHSYRSAGLSYCVMTKLDECVSLGDALSVLYEHGLPLAYVTDGQAIPDDIATLKSSQLISRAVTMAKQSRKQRSAAAH